MTAIHMKTSLLFLIFALLFLLPPLVSSATPDAPLFFLQDPSDSLCFAGEVFKRCSIDTLFYVTGSPGNYQIHKRPEKGESDDNDDGICISKKGCSEKDNKGRIDVKLTKCSHVCSKHWNIMGDGENGYIMTQGEEEEPQTCLIRDQDTNKAQTAPCEDEQVMYVPLQLQFASASDIQAMSSPSARLIGAASDGDKKLLQQILKEDPSLSVNTRDWDDLTALIPASSSGHLDIVKFLLKEGADVNAQDKDGITALMEASIMGHAKVVEYLIQEGATVDTTTNSGVTALWLAAGEGKLDVVKILLQKGADPNNARLDGISVLMTACQFSRTNVVKLLLEHGADPVVVDRDGISPLLVSAEVGDIESVKALLVAAKDRKDELMNLLSLTGYTALIVAGANGHADVVEYLLDQGADVNRMNEANVTPLMYAASGNHPEAMKVYLDKAKVDLEAQHSGGGTAMLEAATVGASQAMQLLIERGAKVDGGDEDGVTPLMAVASAGDFETQTVLLESLKKTKTPEEYVNHINVASYSGGTAVMYAASTGRYDCMVQLIEEGADIKDIAKATPEYLVKLKRRIEEGTYPEEEGPHVDGVTALHVAAEKGHLDCVKKLLEVGADVSVLDEDDRSALLLAIKGNHAETASELVRAGADPNTPYVDEEGVSHNLLMDAITVENEEFASLLIENGADLYFKDEKQVTTLLQASHRGLVGVTKLLLEKHAANKSSPSSSYIDDPSDEGISPLIAAASEGHLEIAKLLLAAGANANAKDKDGTTALMAASARGHAEAVEALLQAGARINEQNVDGHTALMFAYNGKNQIETLWERYNQFVAESSAEDGGAPEDGGTGPIIREALDNHLRLVDLLIKSGADASIKDKEGHTAKDFDFHPDADAEVLAKEAAAKKMRDASKNEL